MRKVVRVGQPSHERRITSAVVGLRPLKQIQADACFAEVSVIFYPDIIEIIKKYEVKGSKYGLDRTRELLKLFGNPDKKLKIVQIAGSNGKGSIAAYITNILLASGYKTGTFTSPEVYSYAEKFLFDGKIAEDFIKYYLSEVYSASLELEDKPTAFEIETVAALSAFAAAGCEYAVVECGLGGRDDATNAISQKSLAVLSSVSLEHTAILGNTVEEICANKAGIIRDCPVVISALQSKEGRAYLSRYTKEFAGDGLEITSRTPEGQTFKYKGAEYFIRLFGDAQCYNAAVAIEAARALRIGNCKIITGLALTRLAGRCEVIEKNGTTYILDGAHNPAAFSPLLDLTGGMQGGKTLVFGCLSDKDVNKEAELLSPAFNQIITFSPDSYRAMESGKISNAFSNAGANVTTVASVSEALDAAKEKTVAICGSFTVLKEAKKWIEKRQ